MQAIVHHKMDCELGEGPAWDDRRSELLWVDVHQKHLHFLDIRGQKETHKFDQMISFALPCLDETYIVGMQDGIFRYNRKKQTLRAIQNPEPELLSNRFNDGKCDPYGNIWAGTMDIQQKLNKGALYKLDQQLHLSKQFSPVSISNGLAWNKELNRMYYIDSPIRTVYCWEYEEKTKFLDQPIHTFQTPEDMGFPDGMTIDQEGMLWIAHWDGGCVARWHPELGQLIAKVDIPAPRVTSCTFGAKEMTTLYVTTARTGLSKEQLKQHPFSGSIFTIDTNTKGLGITKFQG